MPLSGHFMDTEGPVLVHQTQSDLPMAHGDKGLFLVLVFTPPLPRAAPPFALHTSHAKLVIVILILK